MNQQKNRKEMVGSWDGPDITLMRAECSVHYLNIDIVIGKAQKIDTCGSPHVRRKIFSSKVQEIS